MELNQEEINGRVSLLMQRLGKNQNQFARLMGVTQPAISKYLTSRIPPPAVLLRLARAAGTSVEWILTGESLPLAGQVAESESHYNRVQTVDEKISKLPLILQKRFIALLDNMIESLP